MRNIKLILEYDGSGFSGWQWQPGIPTLQGALEDAIRKTSGETLRVTASGRTDSGVHALGQVVNFHTESELSPHSWHGALNHWLRPSMRVLAATEAESDFSARFSSKSKRYDYLIINRRMPSPIHRNHTWHVSYPLDFEAMKEAAALLLGTHDFTSLRATDCDSEYPVRELRTLDLTREGEMIRLSVEAGGFLRHMVRNIAGTLVFVGRGRFKPGDIPAILEAKNRRAAGPTAPPQGLYLVKVDYE